MADDLYGDLVTSGGDAQVPRAELQAAHARVAQLEAELSAREKKVDKAMKLNTVLVRNLSTIFKTAQVEIARKDAEIVRLREALAAATSMRAPPPPPPPPAASSASTVPARTATSISSISVPASTVASRATSSSSARPASSSFARPASRSRSPSSRSSSSSSHRHRSERRRSRSRSRSR